MTPLLPPGRVVGLDVARCLALVGMIATHTLVPSNPDGSVTTVQQLAGGRSAALFALLAGASLALMSGRRRPVRGRARLAASAGLAVRALLIALVGMLLAYANSGIAVILTYYGVLFLLGIPFLGLRPRTLAALSGGVLLVVPVLSHLVRPSLPDPTYASPSFAHLGDPGALAAELLLTGYYPALPWMAYLLAGMAVGRLALERRSTALRLAGIGAALAAASWWLSDRLLDVPGVRQTLVDTFTVPGFRGTLGDSLADGLSGVTPTESWWWLAVRAPHSSTPFDLAHTLGSALLVIGACLLLGRALPRTSAVAFGAGAMVLSLYSLHVVLRSPELWYDDSLWNFTRHTAVVLAVGAGYRLARQRGPLERFVGAASSGASRSVMRSDRDRDRAA